MGIVGLDLGGTKIAAGVIEDGQVLSRVVVPTPSEGGKVVLTQLVEAARHVAEQAGISLTAVGLGVPGPVNHHNGHVRFAGNIRGWENFPVVHLLSEALDCPVHLENDANAATLAEHCFGAGQGAKSTLFVTISTGVGGGFVQGDSVLHGHAGQGAEIGHITLLAGGPSCCCGLDGCLEALVSGAALDRLALGAFQREMRTRELFMLSDSGNERAQRIVSQSAHWLGIGLASLVKCYDPEVIVLGGGLYLNAPIGYTDTMFQAYQRYLQGWQVPPIRTASLGSDAGLLGAAHTAVIRQQAKKAESTRF